MPPMLTPLIVSYAPMPTVGTGMYQWMVEDTIKQAYYDYLEWADIYRGCIPVSYEGEPFYRLKQFHGSKPSRP